VALDVRWSVAAKDDSIDARLVDGVLGEYREMPGLALTIEHARRLWGATPSRASVSSTSSSSVMCCDGRATAPDSSGVGLRDRDEQLA
jgi:hypothetical protein